MKVHLLMPQKCGLFENNRTACGAVGSVENDILAHYLTGAAFRLTADPKKVTCNACR